MPTSSGCGLAVTWQWLAVDWQWIGSGFGIELAMEWQWSGSVAVELAVEWQWIDIRQQRYSKSARPPRRSSNAPRNVQIMFSSHAGASVSAQRASDLFSMEQQSLAPQLGQQREPNQQPNCQLRGLRLPAAALACQRARCGQQPLIHNLHLLACAMHLSSRE